MMKKVSDRWLFYVLIAVIGFPLVWIGSSFILGYLSGTMRIPYGLLLPSGAKSQIFRVLLPEALAFLFTLLWMKRMGIAVGSVYHLRTPRMPMFFWFLVIGIFIYIAYLAWGILPNAIDIVGSDLLSLLATCIVVGFAEETMYRGAIMQVARIYGCQEWQAWLLGTLAFGLLHVPNYLLGEPAQIVFAQFFTTMLTGTGFYLVYRQTRWLVFAILAHALWDFLLGSAMLLSVH